MGFIYHRTIHFRDTDAAGVVYFANVLAMCHEAYEASLAAAGINLQRFFNPTSAFALPIAHAEVDFRQPMYCGQQYEISVKPQRLSSSKFEISYSIHLPKVPEIEVPEVTEVISQATTIHVCIDPQTRLRIELPPEMQPWFLSFEPVI
jgi:1,4-dihydroxy-2-naphthoyl-CoA hydrolase